MRIIKAILAFWLAIAPILFLVAVFGPAYAPPAKPYVEPPHCDVACMEKLLSD